MTRGRNNSAAFCHPANKQKRPHAANTRTFKRNQPKDKQMSSTDLALGASVKIDPVAVEGELRIRDFDLGVRLAFAKPTKIRDLIKRYHAQMLAMGPLPAVGRVINGGQATEFYLNRKQAIFITAKSETPEATDITIEIIERFDAYERGEPRDPIAVLNDPAAMRGLLLTYSEKVIALQATNAALAPKAEALDRISTADGSLSLQEAAKALQVRPNVDLIKYLSTNGWIYRRNGSGNWLGYQVMTNAGLLEHKVEIQKLADGSEKVREQVKVTPRGLAKLAKIVPGRPFMLAAE
jgi:phage antirepressor YoqD-like protein